MEFLLQKEDLLKELRVFKKIKYINPVLKDILKIYSNNGSLFLTSSNVDMTVQTKVDADIKDCKNPLYFNLGLLHLIVSRLPKNSVICFRENENKVQIKSEETQYFLVKLNGEYSHLNQIFSFEFEKILSIKFGRLRDAVLKAIKFTNLNSDNYTVLSGVNFNLNNFLKISSTNSHFLFISKLDSLKKEKKSEMNLNSSDLKVIFGIDVSRFADVIISFSSSIDVVKFSVDKYIFYFSKMPGDFPKFIDILNSAVKENKNEIIVKKDILLSEVKKAKQVNDDAVKFDVKKDKLAILSEDVELGKYKSSIKCRTKVNKYKEIALDPNYIETILSCIEDDYVHIYYDTELKPLLFNKKDEKYLLMPKRI